ncbi:hypothetical protein DH2020_041260 [Rehmannia glutinosa]|uniref:Helicase ATP-binding domain-containing protein n=1 Tax=Rehmannia glutinosa TaxID=99300 RepID=A0ABR0URB3_REHGL
MEANSDMEFPAFPYKPYPIQLDFMKFLYQSLDRGGISMLESPTGTGKTLSMICSALQWLVDRKKLESLGNNRQEQLGEGNVEDDEPDWMRDFVPNKDPDLVERKILIQQNKIGFRSKGKEDVVRDLFSPSEGEGEKEKANNDKKVRNVKVKNGVDEEDDEEFLLEEYDSEGENGGKSKRKNVGADDDFSSEEEEEVDGLGEKEEETRLKIFFCSRTHSQLSQFMKELRKTKFASELQVVCLGSRKNFCINEEVQKLGNSTRINERCLELQKNKKHEASKMKKLGSAKRVRCNKSSSGCPMLRRRKIEEFRNEIIQLEALDIEDLVRIGRNLGGCPYYGSRRMMPTADLVVLPYQSLLSKSSRESLGLNLKHSVIIIDEAHNLADTLISMYDAKITVSQLNQLKFHLDGYFQRFRNLLGPGNRRYIQTLMTLTRAFLEMLSDDRKAVSHTDPPCDAEEIKIASDSTMTINEFLFALNIDNINLVTGYGDRVAISQRVANVGDDEVISEEESAISGFRALADILSSLINKDSDGKIIVSKPMQTCNGLERGYIKYVMLTGEKIFSEVVDQAHAVILAGGTLQPIEETKERLFPSLQLDQLPFFACGHVIPSENILPVAVKYGPSGLPFDFSYKARSSSTMIAELGLLLSNLVTVVPEGVVVFFSSFDYESRVYEAWKASGILSRIMKKKRVFREPRKSTDVEAVLREYKETIDELSIQGPTSCNGAILLAVVGGKISEGINFSDGAGRCIVMVGLPYPSPSDVELIERVKHIEGLGKTILSTKSVYGESHNGDVETGFHILKSCKGRGKEYYENLCMKAVNQSVGRAIRHINDYAAILLVDARYASDSPKRSFSHSTDKLPQWIKSHLVTTTPNYGEVHRLLHQFFKFHKRKESMKKESNSITLTETSQHISLEEVVPKLRSLSLPHCHLSQVHISPTNLELSVNADTPIKMSNKPSRTKAKPQMLIKQTFGKTKKLFHKTFRNLKSFILVGNQEKPTNPTPNPIFSDIKRDNIKMQELDNFYRSFSEKWESIEVKKKKEEIKGNEQYSTSSMDYRGIEDLKEEKKARKYTGRDKKESSFMAADALAQKMKDLEMMDVNDMDHVLDIEEVLHYYSRLNCPAYVEIVDKFFMDMYSEYHVPQPSRSGSMRKLGSASAHSSMRSLGPLKL